MLLLFFNIIHPVIYLDRAYFEKTDPAARVGAGEMFVVIKVYIAQEPGVGKFLSSAIKPLVATQMPSCVKYRDMKKGRKKECAGFSVN